MGSRVGADAVKEIIPTDLADDVVLTNMIDTANLFVDTHIAASGLTDAILTKIELYLAAHFVALTEERGGLLESEFGDAREQYADVYGKGFGSTRFGQLALSLDSTGTLAGLGTGELKAQFRVV